MKELLLIPTLMLAGCASNDSLYFGTYTRVGIDASSDGVGIGAKNAALNVTPPKSDGTAFDVLGTSDLDIAYTNTVIKEIVAVGEAAKCAASIKPRAELEAALLATASEPAAVGPLIFVTYSSWSLLDLSWGDATATATGINFGYKRGTGIKMPIVDDQVGSAYASITVNTTDSDTVADKSNISGTRNRHTFATGQAAIIKASQEAKVLNDNEEYEGCITQ